MKKNKTNLVPVPNNPKIQVQGTGTQRNAFTLVELIVVITIIAILWTIAFISLQWYSKDARDSVRLTDLSNIDKQLDLYLIKWSKLPLPENAITLQSSWVTIWYQWTFSEEILNKIWVNGWWKDPLDETYYTYRINWTKKHYQIMWYLENGTEISLNLLKQTNAADYTKRYPKIYWKTLWILIDEATNKPLNQLETWTVELRTYTTNQIDMYLSTTSKKSWTWTTMLYWILETLATNQNFTLPLTCPTWFIQVPWSRDLWQPSFCVAKYEMSFAWLIQTDATWDWNTYSYLDNWDQWIVVSAQWNSPIAEITQPQAIAECEAMWDWYHLITNNEWMTIARNIEQQWQNWSSWAVWNWYIYNWISNDLTMWCSGTWSTYLPSTTARATVTWHDICGWKNKLTLSNWEEIWDLSWNVWEHVNKANTIDWADYNLWQILVWWSSLWTWWDDDWIYTTTDMDIYGSSLYLWTASGMWNLYYADWVASNIFIRGGHASDGLDAGVFALHLSWTAGSRARSVGLRCAFSVN